jgi:hypothetical protein
MAESHDENHQARIDDFVEDAVVADPHSIHRILPGKLGATRGARFVREEIDRSPHSLLFGSWKLGDRLHRTAGDLDVIAAHSSPSIAFTSSQGT